MLQGLELKTDLSEVQNALNACQADISNRFLEYKEDVKAMVRSHENEIFNLLSKKANLADVHKAMKSKLSQEDLASILQKKAGMNRVVELEQKIAQAVEFVDKKVNLRGKATQ